jgi:hypothetical protein
MGRGKRRYEANPARKPAIIPLSAPRERALRTLPPSLRPKYAQATPDADALRYARVHAANVRKGDTKGAVALLKEYQGSLKRGYPALDTLLEALVTRSVKDSEAELLLTERRRLAADLLGQNPTRPPEKAEFLNVARDALVRGLRGDGDALADARQAVATERAKRLADFIAWSLVSKGPDALVEQWLQPLYLDRFLWRAHGRDYTQMPWPFRESLAEDIAAAFAATPLDVSAREFVAAGVLPRLVPRLWPDVAASIRSELETRTFSAKWPFDEEQLRLIAGVA